MFSQAVAEISRFLDFIDWRPPPSWIFEISYFNGRTCQKCRTASPWQISCWSVKPLRDVTIFRLFQDVGRPPSWICDACVETTHEGHLMVFITVQNLVGIDRVVLIIYVFRIREFGLKKPIHALNEKPCELNSQKAHPCASPRHPSCHAWKSVDVSNL